MDQIRVATLITPDIELKPGMHTCLVLYYGNDMAVAEEIYKYLEDCMKHDVPVPLGGTAFSLRVEDVECKTAPTFLDFSEKYRITLKGEII